CPGGGKKKPADPEGEPCPIQSTAWAQISLTIREIRRLLWDLFLKMRKTTELIFTWSHFRRTHQAIARYYHYKKRHALDALFSASPL
ncbi:MAG: hypothetical protein RBT82_10180, partial [Desulfomonilia bacterium]|nr:hypothetical protein [Desulfomonilia bacterium]